MSRSCLRFAIAGCGNVAGRHATSLRDSPDVELIAVCDPLPERARRMAERFGCEPFESLEALAARADLDAVSVCVPSSLHAAVARRMLESGKNVLVEKPIDIDPGAARELIDVAEKSGHTLSVVSQHRFHDDVRWLESASRAGRFGPLVTAHVRSFWSRDQAYYEKAPGRGLKERREGGVLANQAVHVMDLLLWLLGPAESVWGARATRTHQIAVEDTAAAVLRLAGGALVTVQASTSVHAPVGESLEIRWQGATVALEAGRITRLETAGALDSPPPSLAAHARKGAPERPLDKLECFRRQYADFITALREKRDPLVRPHEALHVIEVIQEIYAADGGGRRMAVRDVTGS